MKALLAQHRCLNLPGHKQWKVQLAHAKGFPQWEADERLLPWSLPTTPDFTEGPWSGEQLNQSLSSSATALQGLNFLYKVSRKQGHHGKGPSWSSRMPVILQFQSRGKKKIQTKPFERNDKEIISNLFWFLRLFNQLPLLPSSFRFS